MSRIKITFVRLGKLFRDGGSFYVHKVSAGGLAKDAELAAKGSLQPQDTTNPGTTGLDRIHFFKVSSIDGYKWAIKQYGGTHAVLVPAASRVGTNFRMMPGRAEEFFYTGDLAADSEQFYIETKTDD